MDLADRADVECDFAIKEAMYRARKHDDYYRTQLLLCIECGEEIGEDRKAVLPYAIRCLVCQEFIEKEMARHGL